MPTFQNPRYGAFAQARAREPLQIDANESDGFARDCGGLSRPARKPEVAEQIADLRRIGNDFKPFTAIGLCDEPPEGHANRADRRPVAAPPAPRQRPFSAPPAPRALPPIATPAPGALSSCAPASVR